MLLKNLSHNSVFVFEQYNMCICANNSVGRKEVFNNTLNTFYLVIWRRTYGKGPLGQREETHCHHMGYSFQLAARVLLYASSQRQDSTHHSLWYTSRGSLAGTRNSSKGPSWRIDLTTHRTMSERSYHGATSRSLIRCKAVAG